MCVCVFDYDYTHELDRLRAHSALLHAALHQCIHELFQWATYMSVAELSRTHKRRTVAQLHATNMSVAQLHCAAHHLMLTYAFHAVVLVCYAPVCGPNKSEMLHSCYAHVCSPIA